MAGGFNANTRREVIKLPSIVKGTNTQIQLPKAGLLAAVWLDISATVAGNLSNQNALGASSVIKRARLSINGGQDLVSVSGPGFAYMVNEFLGSGFFLLQGQNQGRTAVSATTFNLDMVLPLVLNDRDPIGLINLQNEQTQVTLSIDFEADATVATGATVSCTVQPWMEIFTPPAEPADMPPLNAIIQTLEETSVVSGAGDVTYPWPRCNTYLQIAHGLGFAASGSDAFSNFAVRVNQSNYLQSVTPDYLDIEHRRLRGRARPAGIMVLDLLATSGLGNYGLSRDLFDSARVTDISSVITATGAGTLYTLRRQLVILQEG